MVVAACRVTRSKSTELRLKIDIYDARNDQSNPRTAFCGPELGLG